MAMNINRVRTGLWTMAAAALCLAAAAIAWHYATPVRAPAPDEVRMGSDQFAGESKPKLRDDVQPAMDRIEARSLRAPLVPPSPPAAIVTPPHRLTGTIADGDRSLAFIQFPDGQLRVLSVAETVDGLTLLSVRPRGASVRLHDRELNLVMAEEKP